MAGAQAAFHDAHQDHGAAIGVEPGIEDQRLQRRIGRALGRGDAGDDGLENLLDAQAAFGADEQRVGCGNGQHAFDLRFGFLGLRGGQVDFVDHRNDGQVVLRGEEGVGDGLGLDALAGVDHQQRAFAGGKARETS